VSWKVGRVFHREEQVYQFDLLPEPDHKMPAMINLQQYYLEEAMVAACERSDLGRPALEAQAAGDGQGDGSSDEVATLTVETPDGVFQMEADWVIACDGANSDTRRMVNGRVHRPVLPGPLPDRRRGDGRGLPHRTLVLVRPALPPRRGPSGRISHAHQRAAAQAGDNVWRIDFQLGWDSDPEEEKKPEKVIPRIQAMLGPEASSSWSGCRSTSSPAAGWTTSAVAG
jgi:3-(3-hydroxy-phenyl)propionate hydroxylase